MFIANMYTLEILSHLCSQATLSNYILLLGTISGCVQALCSGIIPKPNLLNAKLVCVQSFELTVPQLSFITMILLLKIHISLVVNLTPNDHVV